MDSVRLEDYQWLVSREAAGWLERAAGEPALSVALISRLRKHLSAERARLVVQQVELRRRAAAKFFDADRMYFTPVGLEQATDQFVAQYKASRFPPGEPVADLCCGIGGDLLALASGRRATGVDRDPIAALVAEANARAFERTTADVLRADVEQVKIGDYAAWHLDPDRRPEGRRTTHVELHEPGPETIRRLVAEHPDAALKLAPAAAVPEDWTEAAELEWISRDRQCRQLVAWFGRLAGQPGSRRATILDRTGGVRRTVASDRLLPIPRAAGIGRFIADPDSAVVAAGLVGELASEHSLSGVGGTVYLTGDRLPMKISEKTGTGSEQAPGSSVDTGSGEARVPVFSQRLADPALACFEVTDVMPLDLKRLKQLLRSRRIGRLEIKKRGVQHKPEELRRRLELAGDESAALFLCPIGPSVTAILARRL